MRACAMILAVCLAGCAKHYRAEGLVLRADPARRTVLVSHRPIDGYMPAMAMNLPVGKRENLAALSPGTGIDFDLRVSKTESTIRRIRPRVAKEEIRIPR